MRKNKSTSKRRFRINSKGGSRLVEESTELPEPTEQEKTILQVLQDSFVLGDDAARASARFLRDTLVPRMVEGNEQQQEFVIEEFDSICDRLAKFATIKRLLPIFGLQDYEQSLISLFIEADFGKKPYPQKDTSFYGDRESLFEFLTREGS